MINFTIIIGRKYFSNCVTQSNYLIIQTKLLNGFFKNNIETKEYKEYLIRSEVSFAGESVVRLVLRLL